MSNLIEYNHFKVYDRWFFVSATVRKQFVKMFEVDIKEGLYLSTGAYSSRFGSSGSIMKQPIPIKMYSRIDLVDFVYSNKLEHLLEKAFEKEEIDKIRGKVLVRHVHQPASTSQKL